MASVVLLSEIKQSKSENHI